MDLSGDESLLKQQKKLPWNAVGFVCTFSSSFLGVFGKALANAPPTKIKKPFYLSAKYTLKCLNIHFSLHLSLSLVPPKADTGERRAGQLLTPKTQPRWHPKLQNTGDAPVDLLLQLPHASEDHPRQSAWVYTMVECLAWLSLLKGLAAISLG